MNRLTLPSGPSVRTVLAITLFTMAPFVACADDWPQWLGPKRDSVWREEGILDKFPSDGPKVKWRVPVGPGYAGPAVADGKVFVTDLALNAGVSLPKSGFSKATLPGKERVLCLEASSGKELWKYEYDCTYEVQYASGPRTTPVVDGGKVYTLGTMGNLVCIDVATGKAVWTKDLRKEYKAPAQMWGFAAHPLVEGDKLICLVGGDALVVAFDKNTGKELWHALKTDQAGYCPPMVYQVGSNRQLIIWYPEAVASLDPETGKEYWSQPFEVKAALTIPTPRMAEDRLFVTSFYNGPMMLKLDADKLSASVAWKGKSNSEQPRTTDGLHSILSTPFIKDGYIYGVCSYGQLRCLKADTGERVWETLQATGGKQDRWANAFLIAQGDRFFLFNEKGDLIIARLTPKGYDEISKAHILEPTNKMIDHPVVWMHPAFANKCMYARNDRELVCVSLASE